MEVVEFIKSIDFVYTGEDWITLLSQGPFVASLYSFGNFFFFPILWPLFFVFAQDFFQDTTGTLNEKLSGKNISHDFSGMTMYIVWIFCMGPRVMEGVAFTDAVELSND